MFNYIGVITQDGQSTGRSTPIRFRPVRGGHRDHL